MFANLYSVLTERGCLRVVAAIQARHLTDLDITVRDFAHQFVLDYIGLLLSSDDERWHGIFHPAIEGGLRAAKSDNLLGILRTAGLHGTLEFMRAFLADERSDV